jgi:hypothetical protein
VRLRDWPQRLQQTLEVAKVRSFAYGGFDCALFAADCVRACTGVDPAAELRGYASREEAETIIARYGSLTALVTALMGEPIEPAFAQRGDIVLSEIPSVQGGESIGVCMGAFCAFPDAVGLRMHPRTVAKLAWRV